MDDVFAQAVSGVDEDRVAKAGFGVDSEDDAARRKVGAHHSLNADGEGDLEMVKALVHAIRDGAVGEE